MSSNFSITRLVKADESECYRAFTNATAVREWLCDTCTMETKKGGRLYVGWNEGYQACGNFLPLEKDKTISFTWRGMDEAEKSTVNVSISKSGNGSEIKLTHSGVSNLEEIKKGWETGFDNLVSVLETGVDLRIANRPMLGVLFGEFNEETATKLGVPVKSGMKLDDTVDGMGARKAGLQKDDVIISMDGVAVKEYSEVVQVIQKHKAGEKIPVEYYRGSAKQKTLMELSARPLPEMPATAALFAEKAQAVIDEAMQPFEAALKGVSEVEADFHPEKGEWSVKEILAHLIFGEHGNQTWLNGMIFSQEPVSDGYADNFQGQIEATVNAYGSMEELLTELKRAQAETVGMIRALPPEFLKHKGSYWKVCMAFLQPQIHILGHLEQVQEAVKASREL